MAYQDSIENGKLIYRFTGRMDTINCNEAEKGVLDGVEKHQGQVIFDLREVDYIASSFLRLCGKVVNQVKVGNFAIVNVAPPVKKVFKIVGLADRLNIS